MSDTPKPTKSRHWTIAILGLVGLSSLMAVDRLWLSKRPSEAAGEAVAATERQYAQQRADLCGAGNAVGVGLRGDYFLGPGASGEPASRRTDKVIDFDAGFDVPRAADGTPVSPQSIRWTGWIKPPLNGRYRFHFDAPGVTVTVARQIVSGPGADPDASVEMAIGRFYPIVIEANRIDPGHPGRWRLEWTAPHGLRYLVPTALLFMPSNPNS
jgi:hypothetical protein